MSWQSIETAPKDGSLILLARIGKNETGKNLGVWWACSGKWRFERPIPGTPLKIEAAWTDGIDRLAEPTHWMPLPEAPR